MMPNLEGHILAGRLMGDDKKIVRDFTKPAVQPKNILTGKRQECMTNIKQLYNERHKFKKAIRH